MPGSLERRDPSASALTHGAAPVAAGRSSSLGDFEFTKRALTYGTDMPRVFRRGGRASTELTLRKDDRPGTSLVLASSAPTVIAPRSDADTRRIENAAIASGVRQLAKLRRSGDRIVQRRIGWQATPDRIVLTTAERAMSKNPEGKYAPAGDWLIEDRRTFRIRQGKAEKRTGTVRTDDPTPAGGTTKTPEAVAAAEAQEAAVSERFPEGAQSMGFLPSQVRRSMVARVPQPTQFDGVILQAVEPPHALTVHVLRMDQQRAIVVQATQEPDGSAWKVTQAHYLLTDVEIEAAQ